MDRRLFMDDLHEMPGLSPEEQNEINTLISNKKTQIKPEEKKKKKKKKKKSKKIRKLVIIIK